MTIFHKLLRLSQKLLIRVVKISEKTENGEDEKYLKNIAEKFLNLVKNTNLHNQEAKPKQKKQINNKDKSSPKVWKLKAKYLNHSGKSHFFFSEKATQSELIPHQKPWRRRLWHSALICHLHAGIPDEPKVQEILQSKKTKQWHSIFQVLKEFWNQTFATNEKSLQEWSKNQYIPHAGELREFVAGRNFLDRKKRGRRGGEG